MGGGRNSQIRFIQTVLHHQQGCQGNEPHSDADQQEIASEISTWRNRLETAEKRSSELAERKASTELELEKASALPAELAEKRAE